MREIYVDLSNLDVQYDCGHCGEANATNLIIDVSVLKEDASFLVAVFKNGYAETYCSERCYVSDMDSETITVPLWDKLTKTQKEIAVVEAYAEDENGDLTILAKSDKINLYFENSINSDDVLFDDKIEGLYKELIALERKLNSGIDILAAQITLVKTATDNANQVAEELLEAKANGEFNGSQGPQGEQGEQGEPGKDAETDTELSEDSNNAIANSTVTKILSSGRLRGIESITSYEQFEEVMAKYIDGSLGDDEYAIFFVPLTIINDEGDYVKKGIYIFSNEETYEMGDVSSEDLEAVKKALSTQEASIKSVATDISNILSVLDTKADSTSLDEVNEKISETKQDISALAEELTNAKLTVLAPTSEEEYDEYCEKITEDLTAYAPCLIYTTLMSNPEYSCTSYLILDSGTGDADDAYVVPMSSYDYVTIEDLKSRVSTLESTVNAVHRLVLKPIVDDTPMSELRTTTGYVNGQRVEKIYLLGSSTASKIDETGILFSDASKVIFSFSRPASEEKASLVIEFQDYNNYPLVELKDIFEESATEVVIEVSKAYEGNGLMQVTQIVNGISSVSYVQLELEKSFFKLRFCSFDGDIDNVNINYIKGVTYV